MNKYTLKDLIKIGNGKDYRHLSDGTIPVYGSGGIMRYVNDYIFDGECILLPRKGTLDNIMYVSGKFWTVDTMYWATVNPDLADTRYLYLYLSLLDLSNLDTGSALPSMTNDTYNMVPVELPDISIQRAIADSIFAIRNKILINNAICSSLESMAKLLYDYWFVQFDFPDENGRPYKSSGGKMVWNEELKREIPEGWEVNKLPEVCDLQYGFPLSTELFSETGVGIIRIRDILDNSISAKTTETVDKEYFTEKGDLLVGMDGNFQMNYWTRSGDIVNQRITRIRKNKLPLMIIKMQIEPYIKAKITNVARSTVGHLGDADFKNQLILMPHAMKYPFFENALQTIVELRNENQQLASLQDFLLPMLMNGQVKVGKVGV